MNRLKEVLKNKGISQTWLAGQMDKWTKVIRPSMNVQETKDTQA